MHRLLHAASITSSLSRAGGEVTAAVQALNLAMASEQKARLSVLGGQDEFTEQDRPAWGDAELHAAAPDKMAAIGYAPEWTRRLDAINPDLAHAHGLWQGCSAVAAAWGRQQKRPYLVSPHEMLDPWAWRQATWKKRLALTLVERRRLQNAACLHALHAAECRTLRQFGFTNPIAVIPHGLAAPELGERSMERGERIEGRGGRSEGRMLLSLGRLHRRKGLWELLSAWARLSTQERSDWRLTIAGWDDGAHESVLMQQAKALGIADSVDFVGPKFGEEKHQLLASASGFVLPSFSERLPMTVPEAWSYALPVVMTDQCQLPEGFENAAAIRVEPRVASIAEGIRDLLAMSPDERRTMGERGRHLIEQRFTWPEIARQMGEVYQWTLGGGAPPDCVECL